LKIGLYGGTFDPIHTAHLLISQYIKEELSLDKVIFVPAAMPPHKETYSPPEIRLQMVYEAIAGNQHFECSEFEIHRHEKSYSVDTIRHFRDTLKPAPGELFWIMGSDNFLTFDRWKDPEAICDLCDLVVFPRRSSDYDNTTHPFKQRAVFLHDAPILDISSTRIRTFVRQGRDIRYMVPETVATMISHHELYKR